MRCNHTLRTLRFACCATAWRRYAVLGCSPIDDMSRILRSGRLALQPLTTAPRSVLPILALLVKERRYPFSGPIGKHEDSRLPMGACGGADRVRTDDPRLAKPVLCQLSYSPARGCPCGGSGWIRTNDPRLIKTVL